MSSIVGLSIIGITAPSMMRMSIAPHEAQLQAKNLGVAETAAVVVNVTFEGHAENPHCHVGEIVGGLDPLDEIEGKALIDHHGGVA